jgi:hypothetical protein
MRVSGRTKTEIYGSTEDMLVFQMLTGGKSFDKGQGA